jgi:hypothetical protein
VPTLILDQYLICAQVRKVVLSLVGVTKRLGVDRTLFEDVSVGVFEGYGSVRTSTVSFYFVVFANGALHCIPR